MDGVAKFFKQHRKWLTLIGGMTLFLTYVVKEGLRDSAKDQLAAMTKAETEYRQNTNHTEEMDAIENGPHTRGFVTGQPPMPTKSAVLQVATGYHMSANPESLSDTDDLARMLPKSNERQEKRKIVSDEQTKIEGMYSKLFNGMTREAQFLPSTDEDRKIVNQMSDEEATFEDAVMAYTNATLEAAHKQHEKVETRYRWFTIASYFLFTFGLVVSIIGKLLEPSDDPLEADV